MDFVFTGVPSQTRAATATVLRSEGIARTKEYTEHDTLDAVVQCRRVGRRSTSD